MPFKVVPKGYISWIGMRRRCGENPKISGWADYGGRGIKVCERWQSFANFIQDMGEPGEGLSIDRIDVNGHYEPGNCRWATSKEQQANRRNNVTVTIQGTPYKLTELSAQTTVTAQTIQRRASRGLNLEDVLNSERKTSAEWSAIGRQKLIDAAKSKTHCPNGHELSGRNRVLHPQGWNVCRICYNARKNRERIAREARQP